MTTETSLPEELPNEVDEPEAPEASAAGSWEVSDAIPNLYGRVAGLFLVITAVLGLALAIKLSAPGFLDGELTTYGRLQAAFNGVLLYGWLTIGGLAAIFYLLPRLTAVPISRPLALLALAAITAGVGFGTAAVLVGDSQGRIAFELPWYADVAVAGGILLAALVVTGNARQHREPRRYVSISFFVGAVWWLLVGYVGGSLPWFDGTSLELALRYFENLVVVMWVIPVALGLAYYLVPKITDSALYSERLGFISFWTLTAGVWLGPVALTFGPGPEWLETISVLFAIAMLLPVMASIANLALTAAGGWGATATASIRYVALGLVFLALFVLQLLGLGFRSASSFLQFTSWVEGGILIPAFGVGTSLLLALVAYRRGTLSLVPLAAFGGGLILLIGTLWIGGLQTGLTWAGAGGSQFAFNNFGDGFVNTTANLAGYDAIRWVAWAVMALGLIAGALDYLRPLPRGESLPAPGEYEAEPEVGDLAPGSLAVAAVALAGVAFLVTVLAPASELDDVSPSLLALSARDYDAFAAGAGEPQAQALFANLGLDQALVAEGRDLYISEGCVYCHTQQVRANITDAGLGAVTRPGDITFESPVVLGRQRIGPDLMHVGSRLPSSSVAWVEAHLSDPQAVRKWSAMPSYSYLSDSELNALAQYLVSLQ